MTKNFSHLINKFIYKKSCVNKFKFHCLINKFCKKNFTSIISYLNALVKLKSPIINI